MRALLEDYIGFLFCSEGQTSATRGAKLLNISHDRLTRFLNQAELDARMVWKNAEALTVEMADSDAVLIIDDTIQEKPYRQENELVTWHWDHTRNRSVKGVQILSLLYQTSEISTPVSAQLIKKTEEIVTKEGKRKRKSLKTKNELFREMLQELSPRLRYKWVLADCWFSSAQNMKAVCEAGGHFIFAVKSNRLAALTEKDKKNGLFQRLDKLEALKPGQVLQVWFEQLEFPVYLVKEVFKDEDNKLSVRYLATSDSSLNFDQTSTIYQRRWKVEEYHRSLKQHFSLGQCPAYSVKSQSAHIYAAILAVVHFQKLKFKINKEIYPLKEQIYMTGLKIMLEEFSKQAKYKPISHDKVA